MANDPKQPQKTIMGWSPLQQMPGAQQVPFQPPGAPPQAPPSAAANPYPPQPGQMPVPGAMPPAPQPFPGAGMPPQFGAPPPQFGAPPPPQFGGPPPQFGGQPQPFPGAGMPPQFGGQPQPFPGAGMPPQPGMPPYGQPPQQFGGQPQPFPGAGMPPQPGMPPYGQPPQQQPWQPQPAYGGPGAQGRPIPGADATTGVSARVRFIRLTYLHLFAAILAFAGLEWLLFTNETLGTKVSAPLVEFALGGRANWAAVLGVFMVVSIGTHFLAEHTRSKVLHYIGLAIYVVAEALIFVPLLAIVQWKTAEIIAKGGGNPNIVRDAAYITLGVFGALTASVFITKKDFSFLRTGLVIAGAAALGLIALSLIFGFNLGIVFAVAMVIFAAAQILYETSQIMAHDDPENYVGAALSLFSSVALLFWYVIQIVMKLRE